MTPRSAGTLVLLLITTAYTDAKRWRWSKRANITIPTPYSIGASQYWEGNDGPWSSFPVVLGTNSQRQTVRVMPATAAYNTWTVSPLGCPAGFVDGCEQKRGAFYNVNQSSTWVRDSIYPLGIEDNLGLDSTARAGYDTVSLGWQGSGGPEVQHSVVYNMEGQTYWLGVFGLNPMPTNFSDFNEPQTSFMQSLYDNGKIPSVSYGYTAGNQYRNAKVFGSLTLGGYDEARFTGGISWPFYEDVSRDLLVTIKSIGSGTGDNLLPGGQITAYVDSTVPTMWLPLSACQAFEKAFGLTYNTSYSMYLVDAATHANLITTNPSVTFTLTNGQDDVQIRLPYGAFDLNVTNPIYPGTHYYFPLSRAANDTQYTLGRTFLQEAYLIADYDRRNFTIAPCAWDQSKLNAGSIKSILSPNITAQVNAQQTAAGSTKNHSLSIGAIVGIALGAVVLILIVAIVWLILRRRSKKRQIAELSEKGDGVVYAKVDDEDVGELHNDVLGEMEAPYRPAARELDGLSSMDPNKHGYREMQAEEHYAPKAYAHEMVGTMPVYEMPGTEPQELPDRDSRYSWRR